MAFIGNNPKFNTGTLTPQSTVPSNPTEGMIYYDDGTNRTEGPYIYQDGAWGSLTQPKKNFIQNGNFDFWQRREDFGSYINITSTTYTADRFRIQIENTGGVFTVAPSTTVPSVAADSVRPHFAFVGEVSTADAAIAAGDFVGIEQTIEGPDLAILSDKEITVSFWVRSSTTGTYCLYMQNSARNRSYVKEFTIDSADNYEKKTITFSHDATGTWNYQEGTAGVIVGIALSAGTDFQGTDNTWEAADDRATSSQTNLMGTVTNNIYLSQFKLEIGANATAFTRSADSMAAEFEACKRYFESIDIPSAFYFGAGRTLSAGRIDCSFEYSVRKRTTPSASIVDSSGSAVSPASTAIFLTSNENGTAGASAAYSFPVVGENMGMIRLTADNTVTAGRVGTFATSTPAFIQIDSEF